MTNEIKNPAGGPGFVDGCGETSFPQDSHDSKNPECQEYAEPVDLLQEGFFFHMGRWAEHIGKSRRISAEIERLTIELREVLALAYDEKKEAERLQCRAHGWEVEDE